MSDSDSEALTPASTDLCNEIERSLLKTSSVFGGGASREFLPEDKLDLLLTESRVDAVLREQQVVPTPELIEFILSRAKRLFLTLLWIEHLKAIKKLQAAGFDDGALPVEKHEDQKGISSLNKNTWTLDSNATPLPVFKGWKRPKISNLVETQWRFLSVSFPVFKFYPLACEHRLPLLPCQSDERGRPSSGGFSSVYQLRLLGSPQGGQGHASSQAEYQVVAVKKFDDSLVGYFHKERKTIDKIYDIESHPHLIKPIAVFERGTDRCVLFPWAYGGNLSDFWRESDALLRNPDSRAELVSWCLGQMVGIADALRVLHHENCRHGDLKPENLLHFKDGDQRRGRLVVADFGLSKFHIAATARRDGPSSNWSRTHKYEAPEIDGAHRRGKPRSRDYDMWSMGCLFLEFAVWLVYGNGFLEGIRNPTLIVKYWQYNQDRKPEVHPLVRAEMAKILEHSRASSATKDIVQLVQDRLLVVKFPEPERDSDESDGDHPVRPSAEELLELMSEIQRRANSSSPYLKGRQIAPRTGMGDSLTVREKGHGRKDSGVHFSPGEEGDPEGPRIIVRAPTGDFGQETKPRKPTSHPQTYREEQTVDLNDRWGFSSDNDFARTLFQRTNWVPSAPTASTKTVPCGKCRKTDFFSPRSEIPFDQDELRVNAGNCDICAVIHEALFNLGWGERHGTIFRVGPEFRVASENETEPLVLSAYADPRTPTPDAERVAQVGYPNLPDMGSPQQFEIMRAWLDTCDHHHEGCYPWMRAEELPYMPTRVIDVGTLSKPVVRLVETSDMKTRARYVALSHCWGQLTDAEKFCTTRSTLNANKTHIPLDRLPKNFRDAVAVAREIGAQYLWIDSICIIQGDEADWKAEAQKMKDVFSSAYCTLAASSAESSIVGFLGPKDRETRKVAILKSPGGATMYLCRSIDNFHSHVEGSVLASRGVGFPGEGAFEEDDPFYIDAGVLGMRQRGPLRDTRKIAQCEISPHGRRPVPRLGPPLLQRRPHHPDAARVRHVLEAGLHALYRPRRRAAGPREPARRHVQDARRVRRPAGVPAAQPAMEAVGRAALAHRADEGWCVGPFVVVDGVPGAIDYVHVPMNDTDWFEENLESPFEGNKSLREEDGDGDGDHRATHFRVVASGLKVSRLWWKKGVTMDHGDDETPDVSSINRNFKCVVVGEQRTVGRKQRGRGDLGDKLQRRGKRHNTWVSFENPGLTGETAGKLLLNSKSLKLWRDFGSGCTIGGTFEHIKPFDFLVTSRFRGRTNVTYQLVKEIALQIGDMVFRPIGQPQRIGLPGRGALLGFIVAARVALADVRVHAVAPQRSAVAVPALVEVEVDGGRGGRQGEEAEKLHDEETVRIRRMDTE
ncbi:hypothetical protein PG997_000207 [Apiospora hydei]|uniref:Protein kinase domain-containing protein n=1 Tax=Apiospora hydei TaxID=1337664 RepID=A0ABR1XA38_9PEZI